MAPEDFSFPRVADTHFTALPFLWGAPRSGGTGDGREDEKLRVKSFPGWGMESESKRGARSEEGMMSDGEGEEKMDVLWEDFNQAELQFGSESDQKAELRRVLQGADGGVVVGRKKAAVVALLKVLKKLFLLQSSVRLRKTAASLYP